MADPIDLANDLIDKQTSFALKLNRLKQQTTVKSTDNEFCIECSDVIPLARREMGYPLCTACASDAEKRKAQYADSQ